MATTSRKLCVSSEAEVASLQHAQMNASGPLHYCSKRKANSLEAEIARRKVAEERLLHLAAIVESSNDAILSKNLDVFLSGKDGQDIVKHLKNQQETRHIPVIMFSAHPSAEATALTAGADDFIAKPFEIDELLAKVVNYLRPL